MKDKLLTIKEVANYGKRLEEREASLQFVAIILLSCYNTPCQ